MKRAAAGEYRWALTLFPTHAYASEAGMSLREYEDFFYAACLADDGDPVTAWQRQSDEVSALAEWIEGKEEVHITGAGHRPHARRGGAHLDPLRGRAQHARRRVLHRPGRGLGERRGGLLVPGQLRRPRGGGRALPLRGRQGRGRLRRAGRGVPASRCSTPTTARAASARSASAPTSASPPAPRRSCSTRRSAGPCTWRSGCRYPETGGDERAPPCTGTWSATCARAARSPWTGGAAARRVPGAARRAGLRLAGCAWAVGPGG